MLKRLSVTALILNAGILFFDLELGAFDARLWYPAEQVPWILAGMGPAGRKVYVLVECFDLFLLTTYTLLFVGAWGALFSRRGWHFFWPWLPGLFDLIETVSALYLAVKYPEGDQPVERLLACATPLKWAFLAAFLFSAVLAWRRRSPVR